MTEDRNHKEQDAGEFMGVRVELGSPNPRLRAIRLLLDDLEYPNRDLRLSAQVLNCRREVEEVLSWLRAELRKEAQLEALFDDLHSDND
jgi:hypothetical protein